MTRSGNVRAQDIFFFDEVTHCLTNAVLILTTRHATGQLEPWNPKLAMTTATVPILPECSLIRLEPRAVWLFDLDEGRAPERSPVSTCARSLLSFRQFPDSSPLVAVMNANAFLEGG